MSSVLDFQQYCNHVHCYALQRRQQQQSYLSRTGSWKLLALWSNTVFFGLFYLQGDKTWRVPWSFLSHYSSHAGSLQNPLLSVRNKWTLPIQDLASFFQACIMQYIAATGASRVSPYWSHLCHAFLLTHCYDQWKRLCRVYVALSPTCTRKNVLGTLKLILQS